MGGCTVNCTHFEPPVDIVVESELDQENGIHRQYQGRNPSDGMFPDVVKIVSRDDGKE